MVTLTGRTSMSSVFHYVYAKFHKKRRPFLVLQPVSCNKYSYASNRVIKT